MNIFQRVKQLGFPLGKYVVVGGVMEAYGIRQANDIDIVVANDLFHKLIQNGWVMCDCDACTNSSKKIIKGDGVDILSEYSCGEAYKANTEQLIKNADLIDGVPFIGLTELRKWKQVNGREKDLKDIKLIDAYLKSDN